MTEPTSLPPKRSPIWRTLRLHKVTQLDWTFSILSRYAAGDGEGAEVLDGGGASPSRGRQGSSVLRLEAPRIKAVKPPVSSELANDLEVVDAVLEGLADAEHHGGGGAHAELVGGAVDIDPVLGLALEAGDAMADLVVEDLGTAAEDGLEAGVAEAHDGVAEAELQVLGDGEDLAGGEAVEPDVGKRSRMPRKSLSNQSILRVGVKAALHEDAGCRPSLRSRRSSGRWSRSRGCSPRRPSC